MCSTEPGQQTCQSAQVGPIVSRSSGSLRAGNSARPGETSADDSFGLVESLRRARANRVRTARKPESPTGMPRRFRRSSRKGRLLALYPVYPSFYKKLVGLEFIILRHPPYKQASTVTLRNQLSLALFGPCTEAVDRTLDV